MGGSASAQVLFGHRFVVGVAIARGTPALQGSTSGTGTDGYQTGGTHPFAHLKSWVPMGTE